MMAKSSGLGDNAYVDGVDLSGDTQALGAIGGGNTPIDVTAINVSAFERLGGKRDGRIEWTSYFNQSTGQAHPTLSDLPRADRVVSYLRGTTLGGPAAGMVAKQINYDPTRAADGSLTIAVQAQANHTGLEWGRQLTAGIETFDDADATTGVDFGGSTSFGLQAYLHVFAFSGTDATVAIQESSDDDDTDSYEDVTGGEFDQIVGAPVAERIITARDQAVEQWLRVNVTTSGGFSDLQFAVIVVKNTTEVLF